MKKEDRIKTTVGLGITDERDFLEGKIVSIDNQKCFDGSEFEKIMIKLDDGRILPCIREELEYFQNKLKLKLMNTYEIIKGVY